MCYRCASVVSYYRMRTNYYSRSRLEMNEKQQQIVALRGEFVSKCLLTVGDWSIIGNGYENYPDPQWYTVSYKGNRKTESYWDSDALEEAVLLYARDTPERLGAAELTRRWWNGHKEVEW